MLIPYIPEESKSYYQKYYSDQVGHGMGVFEGSTIQHGGGIGSMVGSLLKSTLPLLKSGAKIAGKELLRTGASIASDALKGRNIKESASQNFKETGSNLLDSLASSLTTRRKRVASRKTKSPRKRRKTSSGGLFSKVKLI
jgi:hypothetical protein